MNSEWLHDFPEKKTLIDSLGIYSMFRKDLLPKFMIDEAMSNKYAGLYYFEGHYVTILPFAAEHSTSERFINLLLHEIGHSTCLYTNRWNRLFDNSPRRSFPEISKLEEQIAESIAMIFSLTFFGTSKGCNAKAFNKYLITNSSKYRLPWEEIVIAVESIIEPSRMDDARKWMNVLKTYIRNNNITFIKEGVFNGE
jgi:hypothetical protein